MNDERPLPHYDNEVDFAALAIVDGDFARHYRDGKIDLQDPAALQQLTKSLLKRDFDLSIELPNDRLCPPVPIRYNYIRFLHNLFSTSTPTYAPLSPTTPIAGLDIGTGASAIYPLLGTSSHPTWTFYATDIDARSLSFAQRNIDSNNLSSRIHLRRSTEDSPLIPLDALGVTQLDFTMCNPPFYSSQADMVASAEMKGRAPSAICTGSGGEMITDGGDEGFVLRMVEESRKLQGRVRWYSSMLGKLGSVHGVVARLKEVGCGNWAVTVLKAGKKTRRWVVAWSWGDLRPRNDVARGEGVVVGVLPFPTLQEVKVEGMGSMLEAEKKLDGIMGGLDVKWDSDQGIMEAKGNVWSRAARRKRAVGQDAMAVERTDQSTESSESEVALAVGIQVHLSSLDVRWLRGSDTVLYESFCGMLKRAMNST